MSSIRILWDFDNSLISVNSDVWIPSKFSNKTSNDSKDNDFTRLIKAGKKARVPWTALMAKVLVAMHGEDISVEMIKAEAEQLPVDTNVLLAIRECAVMGAEQHIVSDANSFYIDAFLNKHHLTSLFTSVETNPTSVSMTGCLCLEPAVPRDSPHNCHMCPPNLCKGAVLRAREWVKGEEGRTIYVGDGAGDECPARTLRKGDLVLARGGEEFPLAGILAEHPPIATVIVWNTFAELRNALVTALKATS